MKTRQYYKDKLEEVFGHTSKLHCIATEFHLAGVFPNATAQLNKAIRELTAVDGAFNLDVWHEPLKKGQEK